MTEIKQLAQTAPSQRPQMLIDRMIVRPDADILTRDRTPNFVGISAKTTGAKGLSMGLVIMPPGAVATPHIHPAHETAIYILKGRVEFRYGQQLEHCQICEAGDFVFTPSGMPHQPRNLSATEPVYALAARNAPDEQEQSIPYHLTPEVN